MLKVILVDMARALLASATPLRLRNTDSVSQNLLGASERASKSFSLPGLANESACTHSRCLLHYSHFIPFETEGSIDWRKTTGIDQVGNQYAAEEMTDLKPSFCVYYNKRVFLV